MTNEQSMMKNNNVLVTGGGGFIGLALVQELCRQGRTVRVLGRHRYPAAEAAGAISLQGDIRNLKDVQQAAAGCDTVFHVAAKAGIWGSFQEYYTVNVLGTLNVLAACQKLGVGNLVYTSTPSVVFDGHDLEGEDESLPYSSKPLCAYATTKILAEQHVLQNNSEELRTAAIRPHLVWGPGDTNLIPRLMARGQEQSLRIVGDGKNRVDIAYIDNVVHAHLLAADNLAGERTAAGHAFFIGQQEPVQLWPWVNELFAEMEVPPVTSQIGLRTAKAVGWLLEKGHGLLGSKQEPKMTRFLAEQLAMSHWFSKKKAETLLGYQEKVSTEVGMERLIAWLR
ncbi:Nucleoside-diphosphate-sugar epimerase [Candidatus Electrothrix aarhusensis]|uniref:Nucleoside-diphosphate-sugar epimerase n=1 Tax=Candidatus Electrothrix aarhusensis TaxID=1859131 RepID=A0A3S3RQ19_9BACT|nr:Nucleoside-diphosphate-sugar epimerase [Candidatus Electrothrix aarhusensis]